MMKTRVAPRTRPPGFPFQPRVTGGSKDAGCPAPAWGPAGLSLHLYTPQTGVTVPTPRVPGGAGKLHPGETPRKASGM